MSNDSNKMSQSSSSYSTIRHVCLVIFAMLQITLSSGLIVGWASIAGSMLITPVEVGGAGVSTLDDTTKLYSIAAAINYIAPLPMGYLLDTYGPRYTSCISNIIVSVGLFLFGNSYMISTSMINNVSSLTMYTIGISFIAFGGPAVQTSLLSIGNLFPNRRFFVMGIVAETITLSFAIFPLLDVIWENMTRGGSEGESMAETTGVLCGNTTPLPFGMNAFSFLFSVLSVIVLVSGIASYYVWPDQPYELLKTVVDTIQNDYTTETIDETTKLIHSSSENNGGGGGIEIEIYNVDETEREEEDEEEPEEVVADPDADDDDEEDPSSTTTTTTTTTPTTNTITYDLKHGTFIQQVTSGVYIRLGIFFIITSYWANYYIATVTTELGDLHYFDYEMQHTLTRWLSFLDAGAIVCAPISGYLLDSVGFIPTAIITICLGIIQQSCLLVAKSSTFLMIVSFTTYAIYRAFLFPYFFASLSRKMGFTYFGLLSGTSFSIAGITQFNIASLATYISGTCHEYVDVNDGDVQCDQGRWMFIHWIQILSLIALLLIPAWDAYAEKQEEKMKKHKTLVTKDSKWYGKSKMMEFTD